MARRTLIDIDNKIIEQTIIEGAAHGVDNISVLTVARKCGITDACVFRHFGTKDNLIISAFKKVNADITQYMFENIVFGDKENYKMFIEHLIEYKDYTKFMMSYGHTKYDKCEVNDETIHLVEFCRLTLSKKLQLKNDSQFLFVWYFMVDMIFHFTCKIIDGTLNLTDESLELVSKVVDGYFSEHVKGKSIKELVNGQLNKVQRLNKFTNLFKKSNKN